MNWKKMLAGFAAAAAVSVCFPVLAQDEAESNSARFIRVVEEDDGNIVKLQLAARSYLPDGKERKTGPTVWLAGAVHIGDKSFYQALQESLDAKDVVLFEGVKPPGAGLLELHKGDLTDTQRADITKKRLRLLMVACELERRATGKLPDSMDQLKNESDERLGRFVGDCAIDGWGHAVEFSRVTRESTPQVTDEIHFASMGADGKLGGEGAAADIWSNKLEPLKPSEIPDPQKEQGIQAQLAHAMGLVFQLDAMQHNHPNWRNSDLSVDQIEDRIAAGGGNATDLFGALSGESFMSKLAGSILKIVAASPMLSTMAKVAMLEMLSQADDVMKMMPGEMGAMMDVIVKDRNAVVFGDLQKVVENEPKIKTAAIIYGAGHMPGLEKLVTGTLGYKEDKTVWLTAIEVDVRDSGLPPSQVKQLRTMLRDTLRQQMKALSKPGK